MEPHSPTPSQRPLRLWPLWLILALALGTILYAQLQSDWPNQSRNLTYLTTGILATLGILLWWLFGSRAPRKLRWAGLALVILIALGCQAAFRLKGVTGDFVPIIEARWKSVPQSIANAETVTRTNSTTTPAADYPQFLGPRRNGILDGSALATNWTTQPPRPLWRQPVGAAWSGFVIVGNRAITQEQNGSQEWVSAFDVMNGRRLWTHTNDARYATTIAGEGPRATPTVVSNRVYTLGATGQLYCLDLATGRSLWSRSLTQDANGSVPEWGFAGSPWVDSQRVVVQAGGRDGRNLLAYQPDTGEPLWNAGDAGINYASPFQVTLAGQTQILIFGRKSLVSHNPSTGAVLWEHPFGTGMPLVANPILVASNQILITAGYSVGAELLELASPTNAPRTVWTSKRLKAKFANPVKAGEFVYGLDDGMLACLDLKDGSQRWKEGRYGHGQGLWIRDHYLLMSETGELILLQPTPDGPHELARIPVFDSKTWNPIALSGDRLLVRNDREAACFLVPLESTAVK